MEKKSFIRRLSEACAILFCTAAIGTAIISPQAFINAIGWVPVETLPVDNYYAIQAQSVARGVQYIPDARTGIVYQYRCTWWVVDQEQKIMMANGHCYNKPVLELGMQEEPFEMTFPNGRTAICDDIIAHSPWEGLDYMAVKCQNDIPPALVIDMKSEPLLDEKLVHISWNCDYIEEGGTGDSQCEVIPMVDFTDDCRITETGFRGGLDFLQGCDSLGGSSGSPVHSERTGLVIGLHHSGLFFNNSQKFGEANGSVYMKKVVEDIRAKGIGIKFATNEEPVVDQIPDLDPVEIDSKIPTEDMSFFDLIALIFNWLLSLFS